MDKPATFSNLITLFINEIKKGTRGLSASNIHDRDRLIIIHENDLREVAGRLILSKELEAFVKLQYQLHED